jgi:hypothetical protein
MVEGILLNNGRKKWLAFVLFFPDIVRLKIIPLTLLKN